MAEEINHVSEKYFTEGGGGRGGGGSLKSTFTSAPVETHNLFNPHEGFLTHQCYISENTKKNQLTTEMKQR